MINENNQVNLNPAPPQAPIPQQPLPTVSPPASETNPPRKGIHGWIITEVFLGILLFLAIAANFLAPVIGEKIYKAKQQEQAPKITNTTQISTADWKEFEGKAIGISFKYPTNWFEEDSTWVSEKKPNPLESYSNNMSLADANEGKVINLIQVSKNDSVENYNKIKAYTLNKSYDDSDTGFITGKLAEGKLKSGEDYVEYYVNSGFSESEKPEFT